MSGKKRWIITTSGDRPLSEVAKELGETGLAVDQVLEEIGIIIGDAGEDVVSKLRAISGVSDIASDSSIEIGPPDSSVTW